MYVISDFFFLNFFQLNSLDSSKFYIADADVDSSLVPWFFRLNYMYYSLIGAIIFTVVGYPISLLTGGTKDLDERLISPIIRKYYKKLLVKNVELEELKNIKAVSEH